MMFRAYDLITEYMGRRGGPCAVRNVMPASTTAAVPSRAASKIPGGVPVLLDHIMEARKQAS